MKFLQNLFGNEKETKPEIYVEEESNVLDEDIPGAIDLGWYYSENKDQLQMAKISERDRATHFYIIGATGTGKTKFMESLIIQDINKRNGFGVIDPHGDLIEDVKGFLACRFEEKEISENVVIVDPTDPNSVVTFNLLENLPNVSVAELAGELVSSFKKVWSDSWGVRMEDLMRNSLIALGEAGFTLAELPQFLTSKSLRRIVISKTSHPIAKDYFRRFDCLTDRAQLTWIEPVMNKINAFFSDERIRLIFSSTKSSFNLREIMDNKKILLIKLDKGRLKGAADLLGSLFMAKIQMAVFSRTDIPRDKRTPFYLYIDEFQNFASESFTVILSEARKYGLSLIMANQNLSQIPTELRDSILGNTGIQAVFRVNRSDATLLAKEMFNYSGYEVKIMSRHPRFWSYTEEWEHKIEELQNLPGRVCYIKHKLEGGVIPIEATEVESTQSIFNMDEAKYTEFLKKTPFSKQYLIPRENILASIAERQKYIKEQTETISREERKSVPEIKVEPLDKPEPKRTPRKESVETFTKDEVTDTTLLEGKGGAQHRYLQTLIKKMAQEKGYRAVIEQLTPDALGTIDISLERNGKKIAIEISITSTEEYELKNIEKCLKAGYDNVILISTERKILEKISQKIQDPKVLFFQPEELFSYLEQESAKEECKEERIKGYKVKVNYQPMKETEKKNKREAISQVIVQAMGRMRKRGSFL